ncbi:MAG: hypothetical protein PSW75_04960, partial [bacterium]|nr:hypothetical protein [bacterium]
QVMARWQKAVSGTDEKTRVRAIDLYGGGVWGELRRRHAELREKGIEVRIVSAGLGLLSPDDKVPAYDATFAPGAENAIGGMRGAVNRNREWWALLGSWSGLGSGQRSLHESVQYHSSAVHLIALPLDYMDAVLEDLDSISKDEAAQKRTVVLAGPYSAGGRRIPQTIEIVGDLYGGLGGTRGTVLARAGLFLAERLKGRAADLTAIAEALKPLYAKVKPLPVRTVRTDAQISDFLHSALRSDASLSSSKLLERFRVAGFACEQPRFRKLHTAVKKSL